MTDLAIRPATTLDDLEQVLVLVDALAEYESLPRPDPEARDRLRAHFQQGGYFTAILAETAGRAVGYAIHFFTYSSFLARPTLYLEDIFVLPDHRRHGVGTAIMEHLVREARDRGCGRIEWQVLDWNQPAIRFYRKLGATHMAEWLPQRLVL